MSIPVSANFTAAEKADVNQVAAQALLILGNYLDKRSTASVASSSSDFSTDFPASGAIDGDRTEINVGAASGAENSIGKSSWRSGGIPNNGDAVYLSVDFGASRTFNRTKVYHLSGHGLSAYKLEYWNGAAWVQYAATTGFGGGGVSFTSTNELDTVDHPDIVTTQIKITITQTVVALDKANIVELEAYRVIDISDRVKSINITRQKDYKLGNNLAAGMTMTLDNGDRFFSPSYSPTATEVVAGFVNTELRPALGIVVKEGFSFGGSQELVTTFVGSIDAIRVRPSQREASIDARDGMKGVIDKITSTTLKQGQDIGNLVQFLLNLSNISTFESNVDTSSIFLDYFFTENESILTSIQKLVQACGDAQFYFTEDGTATFAMYLNSVPQQEIISAQAEWQAGLTQTNIDTTSNPGAISRAWWLFDDFTDGEATSNPAWSEVAGLGNSSISVVSNKFRAAFGTGTTRWRTSQTPNARTVGTWSFTVDVISHVGASSANQNDGTVIMFFQTVSIPTGGGGPELTGYGLHFNLNNSAGANNQVVLKRFNGQNQSFTQTVLANLGTFTTGVHEWHITRDTSGNMVVYRDGVSVGSATDNTYTSCAYFAYTLEATNSNAAMTIDLDDIYFSTAQTNVTDPESNAAAEWVSAVIDQGATITSEGNFSATVILAASTSVAFFTATSNDGLSFDPFVAATSGSPIASTTRRYIKIKAVLTTPTTVALAATLTIFDITINWITGAGNSKYPTLVSYTIRFDTTALEIEQEMSDSLGGDTAVVNLASVTSAPILLTGLVTDTTWQGTVNVPAEAVSVATPFNAPVGVYTFECVVSGGMDTSFMTGGNPTAAVVTFIGGGVGTWVFSRIHPTKPVLVITVTTGGQISDLRLVGKVFANTITPYVAQAQDNASLALYNERSLSIQNDYIINGSIALAIANRLISGYKDPITYLPTLKIRPMFSMQLSDRITLTDDNTGISFDFYVVGLSHTYTIGEGGSDVNTVATVIKI